MNKNNRDIPPFFSIVIANYNSGKYIEEAIISVLNQTCQDFELIVVDGGSTDESVSIIKKYESHYSWWVSEPDSGQSDAFNKGFNHASGEYYCWLNADDLLLEDSLEKVKNAIIMSKAGKWFFGSTAYIDHKGAIVKCYWEIPFSSFVLKNGYIGIGPSSFFHNSLYKECGPFDIAYHYTMDTDLWEKFLNKGYKPVSINAFCWAFRIHEESKTSSSLSGNVPKEMMEEEVIRRRKNGISLKKGVLIYQKIIKVFKCYPMSYFYTLRYRGVSLTKNDKLSGVQLGR